MATDPNELCECGHVRSAHIYHEGACRPGRVCATGCTEFRPLDVQVTALPGVTGVLPRRDPRPLASCAGWVIAIAVVWTLAALVVIGCVKLIQWALG